jgi:hypothetical protein
LKFVYGEFMDFEYYLKFQMTIQKKGNAWRTDYLILQATGRRRQRSLNGHLKL